MKKNGKSVLAGIILCAMALSIFSGCSSGEKTTSAAGGGNASAGNSTAAQEVEVSIWNNDALSPGVQKTPIADEIAKKTGIRLNVVSGDAQKFKVLLAGGDLPDIIFSNFSDQGVDINTLLRGGQLIALDNLLKEHGSNITKNFPEALAYSKHFMSTDGKTYFLPIQVNKLNGQQKLTEKTGASVALYMRYDLYKKAGSPELKTTDDYLNILKKMQDENPKSLSGKKTYAISGFSDWGLWMFTVPYEAVKGVWNYSYDMMYDMYNEKWMNTYYSDVFWDGVKLYNQAYNAGILDPEMFTQKYDNYVEKLKDGATFVTYANWLKDTANTAYVAAGKNDIGVEIVPVGEMNYLCNIYAEDQPFGWGASYPLAITHGCKNPEKAMDLLNFTFSGEGSRLLQSGIEGVHWENVNGVPTMKQEYYDKSKADSNYLQAQGFSYSKLAGLSSNQILSDGFPAGLTQTDAEKAKDATPIDKEFIKDVDPEASYAGQAVASELEAGKFRTHTDSDLVPALVKEPSDNTKKVTSTIDEYMKVALANVVMAKPGDFENQKQKVINEIKAKGYDDAAKEMTKLWENAKKEAADFKY